MASVVLLYYDFIHNVNLRLGDVKDIYISGHMLHPLGYYKIQVIIFL